MYSYLCILLTVISTSLFAHQPNTTEQQTLSIIKPDAVSSKHIGHIISRFEDNGLRVAAVKMTKLSKEQAEQFYAVHKERPFYTDLVEFMSSGPVVILVLKGEDAVAKNRALMGATDPSKAEKNTLRADFAQSVTKNAVHGSDSVENAEKEITFFFNPSEIY
jgi:nucleoside-diphosphate kinase